MNFLRKHWYDIGGIIGILILVLLLFNYQKLSNYELLMYLSLTSLLFHQLEEYRIVGTFPGMINQNIFHSDLPDRYPLNSNTSLIINVGIGWTLYVLAAIMGTHFIWLGMTTILVSFGNIIAHTLLFNIKGKTIYNAGLATSWLLFAPCVFLFFKMIHQEHLVTELDYLIGVPMGIVVNIFGVFKPIKWLTDKKTTYIFEQRQLLKKRPKNNKV